MKKVNKAKKTARAAVKTATTKPKAKLPTKTRKASSKAKAEPQESPTMKAKLAPKGKTPARKTKAKSARASAGPALERVAFTMLQVEDAERARAFYEDLLGLERGLSSPDGTWTEYDLPGGGCLALFRHPAGTFEPSGGAAVAFEVADLDALNATLQAAGVRYQGDVVKGPNCRMSNILDTEGNALILHKLDPH